MPVDTVAVKLHDGSSRKILDSRDYQNTTLISVTFYQKERATETEVDDDPISVSADGRTVSYIILIDPSSVSQHD